MWNLKAYSENIALISDRGEMCTYKQLDDKQQQYAKIIGERKLVFILCTNTIECVSVYVSCIMNKIPIMLIDVNIMKEKLDELLGAFEPRYIFIPHKYNHKIAGELYNQIDDFENYYLLKRNEASNYIINRELALLLSTSGSTGSSKHVRISYKNLYVNTESIVKSTSPKKNHRAITSLPMNYCYGLSIINTHLWVGATILLSDEKIISKKFWGFAENYGVTTFAGVPYTYEVLKKIKIFERNISSLLVLLQAGGKISTEMEKYLREYANKKKIDFFVMYGQTEATARMACINFSKEKKVGSVGKAVKGGRFEIQSPEGAIINEPYAKGEIVYYGENVSWGYCTNKEELYQEDNNKCVLRTKDIGYLDEDGYLYIIGRMDRIVKIQGLRINLEYLEQCLNEKFGGRYKIVYEHEKFAIYSDCINGNEIQFISSLTTINSRIINIVLDNERIK